MGHLEKKNIKIAKKKRQQEKKKALAKESSESETEEKDAETWGAVPSFTNLNIPPEYSHLKIPQDFHHPQISSGFHTAAPVSVSTSERSESSSPAPSC